jgi:hypothetical protein
MKMFERALAEVRECFAKAGLGYLFESVRHIRVVSEESYHDSRNLSIGLNPADVRKPYAAFHCRAYLLVHEMGHHFAETCFTKPQRQQLQNVFGDYDAPYRRLPKPRVADGDHVSRYSMTHPAEDFAETFAVLLWRSWDKQAVAALMRRKSRRCEAKLAVMERLIAARRRV